MVSVKVYKETVPCERNPKVGPMRSTIPMARNDNKIRAALLHKYHSGWILIGLNAGNKPCHAWHTDGDFTSIPSTLVPYEQLQHLIVKHSTNATLHLNDATPVASHDMSTTTFRPYDGSLSEHLHLIQQEAAVKQAQQQREQAAMVETENERLDYRRMLELDPNMTPAQYDKFRKQCAQQQR
jgi:hypothetical protein